MTEDHIAGLWTLTAFLAFIGVCFWAYSGRRKAEFDEAANLPFADEYIDVEMTVSEYEPPRQHSGSKNGINHNE